MIDTSTHGKNASAMSKTRGIGVRGKLFVSFAMVTFLTLIASVIGYYSLSQIEGSIEDITHERVPSMTKAMTLAQLSGSFESSITHLSSVDVQADRANLYENLQATLFEMKKVAHDLHAENDLIGEIEAIEQGVNLLDEQAQKRIALHFELDQSLKQMTQVQARLNTHFDSIIDSENLNLKHQTENDLSENKSVFSDLMKGSLVDLIAAMNLKSQVNALLINLSIAGSSTNIQHIKELSAKNKQVAKEAKLSFEQLAEQRIGQNVVLSLAVNNILLVSSGEANLFDKKIQAMTQGRDGSFDAQEFNSINDALKRFERLSTELNNVIESIHSEMMLKVSVIENGFGSVVQENMLNGIDLLRSILETRMNNNVLYGILSEVAHADEAGSLSSLKDGFKNTALRLEEAFSQLAALDGGSVLVDELKSLIAFGDSENNMFSRKAAIIALSQEAQAQLSPQEKKIGEILLVIDQHVDQTKVAVTSASVKSTDVVVKSKSLLMLVAGVSLVLSMLILWVFVTRNISNRLVKVSKALQALSQGDLSYNIDLKGSDEIAKIANALEVFKERALENERLVEAEQESIKANKSQAEEVARLTLEQNQYKQEKLEAERDYAEKNNQQVEQLNKDALALLSVVQAAAKGDLTRDITVQGNDVSGQLGDGLETLISSFTLIMEQIRESAGQVSTSTQEIVTGNAQLAIRTKKQSQNLQEASDSMQEMTDSVEKNTQNAQNANELADRAQERAEQGSNVVTEAVKAMEDINQSSMKIADIVSVIDEIAFQTNLLALNAAVEAARAGEQGRGFAVVATEVRSLAARSATAAKEIKYLIEDSVIKVDHGVKLVDESGKTLDELLGAVRRVTDIVGEIVVSSSKQTEKIDEVNVAVSKMDAIFKKNQELVKDVELSGSLMQEQSVKLGEHVGFFTIKSSKKSARDIRVVRPTQTNERMSHSEAEKTSGWESMKFSA